MQDFIKMAAGQLGVGEDSVQNATGGLLGLLKDQADNGDVQELFSKLPGAEALAGGAGSDGGGGLLGGLAGGLGGALGGKLGDVAGMLGALQGSGLNSDQLGSLVSMLVDYARQNAGDGLVEKLLSQVPALKGMLG